VTGAKLPADGAGPRSIRVFVSSTFRDMQAERDELVKRVFPQLRKLCEERGVAWGEVDLRWGVTGEQAAEGQVLPICLEEIKRCRPHFLALLGERYGWVPGDLPEELVAREPWLARQRGRSVTELEILHGVLNDPKMAHRALFYFRSPAYVDSLPAEQGAEYREEPTVEEIAQLGEGEALRRAGERRRRLDDLKARIRASGLPLREGYSDPVTLGELVLADLTAIVNSLYPEGTQPAPLEREAAEHEAFARSRSALYIGREDDFARLDAYALGSGPPLVVVGESGIGKSALLANWALRFRGRHAAAAPGPRPSLGRRLVQRGVPGSPSAEPELTLQHFVGATPYSADGSAMLRRLIAELGRWLGVPADIPDRPDALRAAFAEWLARAAAHGRVVLVLDGLNQLEDRDQAPDLVWLPAELPANIRLILSTLPGRPLDELRRRGYPELEVQPLAPDERGRLIAGYLAQYGKALGPDRAARVAAAPQCANPLYLRATLEELRLFGMHERLEERIGHYLEAATVAQLYEKILARYEEDYERDRPGLVGDALSLIWAARRGLSEADLLELLGEDGRPMPRARWSPLYLAAEASLLNRGGLLGFGHAYLRQAVEHRYLSSQAGQRAAHLRLADYFGARELGARRVDEEPWQLAQARDWEGLAALLGDLAYFDAAWRADPYQVRAYWVQVEAGSELRMADVYRGVLAAPGDFDQNAVWRLGFLLEGAGYRDEALALREHQAGEFRRAGDRARLAVALGGQGSILLARGDSDAAMALYEEQERLSRRLGNKAELAGSLSGQATVLYARGDLDGAMALYREEERLDLELGNRDNAARSLGNQALILQDQGDLDGAMALSKRHERLCRELGDRLGVANSLGWQANVLRIRGDLEGAMALLIEEERLCRALGQKQRLAYALCGQALVLQSRGELEASMALAKEAERLFRELGEKAGVQRALGLQALVLFDRGDLQAAMALHKEQEALCRELGFKSELAKCLGNQARVLREWGQLDAAMDLFREAERLSRELAEKMVLALCLGGQALILHQRGDLDRALALRKEEEKLTREVGDKKGLAISLGNQANLLQHRGDPEGAMALHRESERLYRELHDEQALSSSLGNQAGVLYDRGDLDGALGLYREQESICRRIGYPMGLRAALENQAAILRKRGELDRALTLLGESESLARRLGSNEGIQAALGGRGNVLFDRGDLDGAMRCFDEQERLCRALGHKQGIAAALTGRSAVLEARGDRGAALELRREVERLFRELGDKRRVAAALTGQAALLYAGGDVNGLLPLFQELERLYRDLGDAGGLAQSLDGQAFVLTGRGDWAGALALYGQAAALHRQQGNDRALAASLANQAYSLGVGLSRPGDALDLAEEACLVAARCGDAALHQQVGAIRAMVQRAQVAAGTGSTPSG